MTAVRLGRPAARWMTTVTLPFDCATADNTAGLSFRPFWVPLMYSSAHFPGGAPPKYPPLVSAPKRALTVEDIGQAAQPSEFEQATQCPAGPDGSATNNPMAACLAAATSTEADAGLEALVAVVGDPQQIKARTAAAGRRARRNFTSGRMAI